jgi:hypothetical protein
LSRLVLFSSEAGVDRKAAQMVKGHVSRSEKVSQFGGSASPAWRPGHATEAENQLESRLFCRIQASVDNLWYISYPGNRRRHWHFTSHFKQMRYMFFGIFFALHLLPTWQGLPTGRLIDWTHRILLRAPASCSIHIKVEIV